MTDTANIPRVVLVGLASCFGCRINITNVEKHLMDVLGQIDMRYWQLTSSDPMPDDIDVAVIEGAVTTEEAKRTVEDLRSRAGVVMTIKGRAPTLQASPASRRAPTTGASTRCTASTFPRSSRTSRSSRRPSTTWLRSTTRSRARPIDPMDFVKTLQSALYGSNVYRHSSTLCGECKRNERGCFFGRETLCLGLVTRSGCGARCPNLGRPCNGCAGLSPDANVESARRAAEKSNVDVRAFDSALEIFNMTGMGEQLV